MPPERRCDGTKADGSSCGAPPNLIDPETGCCPAHGPDGREKMREIARKGAEATKRRWRDGGLDADELPPLDGPRAAEHWLEVTGRAVATGRLGHREGRTIVSAVKEWLSAHDAGRVSQRLEALMDALAKWRETGDAEPVLRLVEGGKP